MLRRGQGGRGWYGHKSISLVPLGYFITLILNYFPGPRVGNLIPPQKKLRCFTYAHTVCPPCPHIDTCFMQYIVLTLLSLMPPTSTHQNHPTPPHPTQKLTKCPGDSVKSEVKILCLTWSQLIIL